MKQLYSLIIFLNIFSLHIFSQEKVPVLEREISLTANNEPIYNVLSEISKKGDFVFSYSPEDIGANELISVNLQNQTVRQSLNRVFGDRVKYKVRGKYLIIQKNPLYIQSKGETNKNIVEGYITESSTGKKLNNVTVYNSELMVSTVTDKYGYFKIELPPEKSGAQLKVSKRGYADTLLIEQNKKSNFINMELFSLKNADSLISLIKLDRITNNLTKWILDNKLWVSSINISDTLYREFQISFLPQISTNKFFSGNSVVNYSVNILAGYNQEVRKAEFGGILNMVRDDARNQFSGIGNIIGKTAYSTQFAGIFNISKSIIGIQAAGIFNIAADSVSGTQIAGTWNETNGNVKGAQISGTWNNSTGVVYGAQIGGIFNTASGLKGAQIGGIFNTVKNDAEECQVGGIFNFALGHFKGFQVAGIFNHAASIDGTQAGGIFNTSGDVEGVQAGGISNTSGDVDGAQVSGIANLAGNVSGFQLAGIVNQSKSCDGAQISGIVNKTGYFKGVQMSLINIADSCDGTTIGLLNFIKKGYHQLEFSADESFYCNAAFRSGVQHFYSIVNLGYKPQGSEAALWTRGFGLGTTLRKKKDLKYNIELVYNNISNQAFTIFNDDIYKIYTGIEKSILNKVSIAAGITFNALVHRPDNTFDAAPYSFINYSSANGNNLKFWIGGKLAIRFF